MERQEILKKWLNMPEPKYCMEDNTGALGKAGEVFQMMAEFGTPEQKRQWLNWAVEIEESSGCDVEAGERIIEYPRARGKSVFPSAIIQPTGNTGKAEIIGIDEADGFTELKEADEG